MSERVPKKLRIRRLGVRIPPGVQRNIGPARDCEPARSPGPDYRQTLWRGVLAKARLQTFGTDGYKITINVHGDVVRQDEGITQPVRTCKNNFVGTSVK